MLKYRNISEKQQVVIGVSEIAAGAIVEVIKPINNANFELVEDEKKTSKRPKVIKGVN